MHVQLQGTTVCIHQRVSLAALDLLACIVAPDTAAFSGLDALAVDNGCRWARLSSDPLSIEHDEVMVDGLPCARIAQRMNQP